MHAPGHFSIRLCVQHKFRSYQNSHGMAFITEYQHRVFLETLDQSIQQFESLSPVVPASRSIVSKLKEEKDLLQVLFSECDIKTQQLKNLIIQYQDLQRKTRVELRAYRHRYGQQ